MTSPNTDTWVSRLWSLATAEHLGLDDGVLGISKNTFLIVCYLIIALPTLDYIRFEWILVSSPPGHSHVSYSADKMYLGMLYDVPSSSYPGCCRRCFSTFGIEYRYRRGQETGRTNGPPRPLRMRKANRSQHQQTQDLSVTYTYSQDRIPEFCITSFLGSRTSSSGRLLVARIFRIGIAGVSYCAGAAHHAMTAIPKFGFSFEQDPLPSGSLFDVHLLAPFHHFNFHGRHKLQQARHWIRP